MIDLLAKAGIYPTERINPWSRCIDQVAGLEPVSNHQWRLSAGKARADVHIDPGGNLRIAGRVPVPPCARSALETSHDLPGNLRYATRGRHAFLVADTHLDGATHLAGSFAEIKAGLRFVLGDRSAPISAEPLTPETLSEVLGAGAWPEESIVERDSGWELRPRLHGEATPVQAVVEGGSLRIYHTVVGDLANPWGVAPACFEALRFNDRLRLARLAWVDGAITAETRLHRGQLSPSWLETATRAVAVAGRHTKLVLGVLAGSREVAELYANILLPEGGAEANEQ